MPTIETLFDLHTATASGFVRYRTGDVAYVTNGFRSNGIIGFVKPKADDGVFTFRGIAVSAFCEATVQIPPFIARGNGGSGLIVLEPRQPMTSEQLAYIAAYINTTLRWRFSWSRLATVDRLRRLTVPSPEKCHIEYRVRELLPIRSEPCTAIWRLNFGSFALSNLFSLRAGDYHNAAILPAGDIPLISCGDDKNGICRFVDVPDDRVHSYKLTIAFNGMNTLTTKFHPYRFAAKDDVAVCTPLKPLRTSTLFFIQIMMGQERWRYSFYRKCFMDKLCRQSVSLPRIDGEVDEGTIEQVVGTSSYWQTLNVRFTSPAPADQ